MKRPGYLALVVVATAIAGTQVLMLPMTARAQSAAPSPSDDIDPDSIATLNKMGAYLRSLKAFQVESVITRDEVLDGGQQVKFDSHIDLLARMPDRLRVEVKNARQQRLYFYDGKTFTLWGERVNYYATVPAPPTIAKLAQDLDDKYDIELPLEDLFYWGTPESSVKDIKSSIDVGPSEVEGVTCEHYAFHQDDLDWQVWIQQGDYPLPRKLVLTTLTDEARPQYSAVLTWNLAPSFNEAAFEFDPPKDAHKIPIANQTASAEAETTSKK
jgi:hypothetical protein